MYAGKYTEPEIGVALGKVGALGTCYCTPTVNSSSGFLKFVRA